MTRVVHDPADLADILAGQQGRRAVVMTMGALHAGHLALVRRARELAEHVVVTIFVNPLQFGPGEDYDAYPRTLDADVASLRDLGVGTVFAPSAQQMYPAGQPLVTVVPSGPLATTLEGAIRPTHFAGVLTVVAKLMHLTRPDVAVFGQKDAQQLAAVRRMVLDLDFPVQIEAVPIVRDADGLALSSRNAYLTAEQRHVALELPRAIAAGVRAFQQGKGPDAVRQATLSAFQRTPELTALMGEVGPVGLDYVRVVDGRDFTPVTDFAATPEAVLVAAARVGGVRLLDNAPLQGAGVTPGTATS